jgi:pimeloyl-ACP methyl ester carboxylesterase
MSTLILLHGAIGAKDQLERFIPELQENYNQVIALNFPGHGGTPIPAEGLSIPFLSNGLVNYLQDHALEEVDVFGYSMGGYVALHAAAQSNRFRKILTLGTKFSWSPEIAAKEKGMLNPDKLKEKVPAFAQALEKRHAPQNWEDVLHATARLMEGLGQQPALTSAHLESLNCKVLISVGDRDTMVSIDESLHVYRQITNAHFAVLPGVVHPIEKVPVTEVQRLLQLF